MSEFIVNPRFNWFSLQQLTFDTSLQKIANVIPTAAVKQSAKVHGPLVIQSKPNFMINKGVIKECKVMNILETCQKLQLLWHFVIFNMGVNRKILKCARSCKRLIIEQNGWQFRTHGSMYFICRVLFVSASLSSVWGNSVHFAIFKRLMFPKFPFFFNQTLL